jgi:aminomethyltransferase
LLRVVQLQDFHEKNGHLTEFAGFNLPMWFKGIIPESLAVRKAAGIFDVSHMGRATIRGKDAQKLLDKITTNDVSSLGNRQGQYSLLCNAEGGIKDDVIVFRLKENEYLIVYNAGNRSRDYAWIRANAADLEIETTDISDDVAMFAVQGPKAIQIVQQLTMFQLDKVARFGCEWVEIAGATVLISRTGYTGEDGLELYVWNSPIDNSANARLVWENVIEVGKPHGLEPCGLGARDLLRLEAGLCLYGTDMDENTNPYEAKLGFVVRLGKEFIGKKKLREIKEKGTQRTLAAMVTARRVIPRHGFNIFQNEGKIGMITSGTLSPLLNTGIAMGYVKTDFAKEGNVVKVQIRDRYEEAKIVKTPFYDTSKYGYKRKITPA